MTLVNMSPCGSSNYVPNGYGIYPKSFGNIFVSEQPRFVQFSNESNLLLGESGLRKRLPSFLNNPSLLLHICPVVLGCSKEKMFWINTAPIVALVQYPSPVWNGAIVNNPRSSVSPHEFGKVEKSVPNQCHVTGPIPAGARFVNFLPKSGLDWNFYERHVDKIGTQYSFST